MFETIYADAFLSSVLREDATLTGVTALNGKYVYQDIAPQGTPVPRIVFNLQAGGDVNTLNGRRMFVRPLYQVRTVGKVVGGILENAARVRVAAHRMDELLRFIRRQQFTIDSVALNFNVWREDELPVRSEQGEMEDVRYRNYSALYRVEIFTTAGA